MPNRITPYREGGEVARHCAICRSEIYGCNGFVKAGDLLELDAGSREYKDVREMCGLCSEMYMWSADGIGVELNPVYEATLAALANQPGET